MNQPSTIDFSSLLLKLSRFSFQKDRDDVSESSTVTQPENVKRHGLETSCLESFLTFPTTDRAISLCQHDRRLVRWKDDRHVYGPSSDDYLVYPLTIEFTGKQRTTRSVQATMTIKVMDIPLIPGEENHLNTQIILTSQNPKACTVHWFDHFPSRLIPKDWESFLAQVLDCLLTEINEK